MKSPNDCELTRLYPNIFVERYLGKTLVAISLEFREQDCSFSCLIKKCSERTCNTFQSGNISRLYTYMSATFPIFGKLHSRLPIIRYLPQLQIPLTIDLVSRDLQISRSSSSMN
jgi:hypothetical protein